MMLFGIGAICWGIYSLHLDDRFEANATHVSGTVEKLETYYRRGTSYSVTYHYPIENAQSESGSSSVQKSTWSQLQIGGEIPIKYLSNDPRLSRVDTPEEDQHAHFGHEFLLLLGAGWTLFTLWKMVRN